MQVRHTFIAISSGANSSCISGVAFGCAHLAQHVAGGIREGRAEAEHLLLWRRGIERDGLGSNSDRPASTSADSPCSMPTVAIGAPHLYCPADASAKPGIVRDNVIAAAVPVAAFKNPLRELLAILAPFGRANSCPPNHSRAIRWSETIKQTGFG